MVFPDDAPTNFYKLEGVLFIQWTTYTYDGNGQDRVFSCKDESLPEEFLDRSDVCLEESNSLEAAEYESRSFGYHVLYDRREKTIWIFDLSGPRVIKSHKIEDGASTAELMLRYNLKRTTFGSIRASDLAEIYSQSTQNAELGTIKSSLGTNQKTREPVDVRESQTIAMATSTFSETRTDTDDDVKPGTSYISSDVTQIYSKIVLAIKMTLFHSLSKSAIYAPFSSHRLLEKVTRCRSTNLGENYENALGADIFSLVVLGVHWSASGVLLILSYPDSKQLLCCMSDKLAKEYHLSSVPMGHTVYLAPLGRRGKFCGKEVEHGFTASYDEDIVNRESWKDRIKAWFHRLGTTIPDQALWIQVQIWRQRTDELDDSGSLNPSDTYGSTVVLWPALFSFCTLKKEPAQDAGRSWFSARATDLEDISDDHLTNAESWFLARNARNEAMEASRHQIELDAQLEVEESGASDDEDLIPGTLGRYIEAQNIAGVYPTPPDGNRSQAISSGAAQEMNETVTPCEPDEMNVEQSVQRQQVVDNLSTINASPSNDHGAGNDAVVENEDLFGDMDTEMFTASGITEADFNFFDEPDDHELSSIPLVQAAIGIDMSPVYDGNLPGESVSQSSDLNIKAGTSLPSEAEVTNKIPSGLTKPEEGFPSVTRTIRDRSFLRSSENGHVFSDSESQQYLNSLQFQQCKSSPEAQGRHVPFLSNQFGPSGRDSTFGPMLHQNASQKLDLKYSARGKFGQGLLTRRTSPRPSLPREPTDRRLPRVGLPYTVSIKNNHLEDGGTSEDDINDTNDHTSDQDVEIHVLGSVFEAENSTFKKEPRKRKRGNENIFETQITSPSENRYDIQQNNVLAIAQSIEDLILNGAQYEELVKAPTDASGNRYEFFSGHGKVFIQVAQILADQIVLGATWHEKLLSLATREWQPSLSQSIFEDPLREVVVRIWPSIERCDIRAHASLGGTPSGFAPILRPLTRPTSKKPDTVKTGQDKTQSPYHMFRLTPPDVRIRRGDVLLETSSTSLLFWEELGFGPCEGVKPLEAFCIFPAGTTLRRGVISFLSTMESTYQSLKLGKHGLGNVGDFCVGLVPIYTDQVTTAGIFASIDDACESFGQTLSQASTTARNIVIYMVDPFQTSFSKARLCLSFFKLSQAYNASETRGSHSLYHTILKILPIAFLASRDTIVLPSPKEYNQLAMEIYDRCSPLAENDDDAGPFQSSSLIRLAQAVPRALDFKLISDRPWGLVDQDDTFHLGYSWRADQQWLAVCLSDNRGAYHWSASYCIGTASMYSWSNLRSVLKEVWETTIELINVRRGACRLFIVKDDSMVQEEIDTWVSLSKAEVELSELSIMLVLLTVDTRPVLNVPAEAVGQTTYATPISTPTTSNFVPELVRSPSFSNEQRTTAKGSESAFDIDTNTRLVDLSDEIWGIQTVQYFEKSPEGISASSALLAGYLLKRAGSSDDDGVNAMGVRIIYAEKVCDSLFHETLAMYRALGTLAKARGVVDRFQSILPLHVAVSAKARSGLNEALRYDADG